MVGSSKGSVIVKERHRWQPEEDALLRAYVRRYGARDWGLLPQRMGGGFLHPRDAKSCQDRWKNYLRPGLKKGSLTPEEQARLVSLQSKLGNRWKLIAAQLPGRTPKRLGKWWDAFKDRQLKLFQKKQDHLGLFPVELPTSTALSCAVPPKHLHQNHLLPAWMSAPVLPQPSSAAPTGAASCSPSVSLSLSPSSGAHSTSDATGAAKQLGRFFPLHQAAALAQLCMDLEEGRQAWAQHRKEAAWRLSRLEQQLETEKARKRKELSEDVEAKIRCLREEEAACVERLEAEYREQLGAIQRDAEAKEAKMAESWAARHTKLARLAEQVAGASAAAASPRHFTVAKDLH
ncbi:hypothetical protein Taro_034161 [Colocasia esculenta]|uniref:Uncharacterized protein n=1 Tax=Colocasia esculenta TaxID=4460 RepID=A0A843W245_COLES|nr:hypothetical protein [Colocasia esculenta]